MNTQQAPKHGDLPQEWALDRSRSAAGAFERAGPSACGCLPISSGRSIFMQGHAENGAMVRPGIPRRRMHPVSLCRFSLPGVLLFAPACHEPAAPQLPTAAPSSLESDVGTQSVLLLAQVSAGGHSCG